MEFAVDDQVFLKISLLKIVVRFGKKGKTAPRFVVLFASQKGLVPWLTELIYQRNLQACITYSMSHISASLYEIHL